MCVIDNICENMKRKGIWWKIFRDLREKVFSLDVGESVFFDPDEIALDYGVSPSTADRVCRLLRKWIARDPEHFEVSGGVIKRIKKQ